MGEADDIGTFIARRTKAAGAVRWLRPETQCKAASSQTALEGRAEDEAEAAHGRAPSPANLEARLTARGRWRDRLPTILDKLEALGHARHVWPDADHWQAG